MVGLLLKELKSRGGIEWMPLVTSINLTFRWQRELSDKFREKFGVIRGPTTGPMEHRLIDRNRASLVA